MIPLSESVQLGLVFCGVTTLTWFYMRRRKWQPVGRLNNIYLYPIKSGKWKDLDEAECTPLGLKYIVDGRCLPLRDRVFVVYDEESKEFLTGKLNPKMLFITIEPTSEKSVKFSFPDKEDIELIVPERKFGEEFITMWASEKIKTLDCGDDLAKWISEVVRGKSNGLRIGYWPESESWRRDVETLRPVEMKVFKKLSNKFTGAYSDVSGFLLINQNSVQDLKERINDPEAKVDALNFRPNLVIEGPEPYSEDKWDWVKIGDVVFRTFRPCTRCRFTTIDPQTAVKNKTEEPITTLKKYRTMKMLGEEKVDPNIPVMGVYVGLEKAGIIRRGDMVYISS